MDKVTTAFRELPVGARFILVKTPPHGSKVLEKIEPEQYINKLGHAPEGLFYTAKWVDGPHAQEKCVVVTGTEKSPYLVIALP